MAAMLSGGQGDGTDREAICKALFVGGVRYANSAAKFWPALIDEVQERFPLCTHIELDTSTEGPLCRDQLFPLLELENDIERLLGADLDELLRQTIAQLELTGPPVAVSIRLRERETELLQQELPPDCVDAEVFPFLVGWMLEWSGVNDGEWNQEIVDGAFTAQDRGRGMEYRVSFHLANRHLSEGLYRRSLSLSPCVRATA